MNADAGSAETVARIELELALVTAIRIEGARALVLHERALLLLAAVEAGLRVELADAQVVRAAEAGIWSIGVYHDDDCPILARIEGRAV